MRSRFDANPPLTLLAFLCLLCVCATACRGGDSVQSNDESVAPVDAAADSTAAPNVVAVTGVDTGSGTLTENHTASGTPANTGPEAYTGTRSGTDTGVGTAAGTRANSGGEIAGGAHAHSAIDPDTDSGTHADTGGGTATSTHARTSASTATSAPANTGPEADAGAPANTGTGADADTDSGTAANTGGSTATGSERHDEPAEGAMASGDAGKDAGRTEDTGPSAATSSNTVGHAEDPTDTRTHLAGDAGTDAGSPTSASATTKSTAGTRTDSNAEADNGSGARSGAGLRAGVANDDGDGLRRAGGEDAASDTTPGTMSAELERDSSPWPTDPRTATDRDWRVQITARWPHDASAFTQGLETHADVIYESTGRYGESRLRALNGVTELRSFALDADLFGEGLTLIGDEIIQVTWREGRALRWDRDTFEPRGEFAYEGEGWGICWDQMGSRLWMSDGTATLTQRDRDDFSVVATTTVRSNNKPVTQINELECVDGLVVANVWRTTEIIVIDPDSGEVLASVDATRLLEEVGIAVSETDAVLNGIAYLGDGNWILGGKNWPEQFLVTLSLN